MFEDENVMEFCIQNNISFNKYAFIFFVMNKDFNSPVSKAVRYVRKFGMFKNDDVHDLIDREIILDFNSPGEAKPEFYVVNEEFEQKIKADINEAETLWKSYPPTFSVDGKNFIARNGGQLGSKQDALNYYLKVIKKSKKKHEHVLKMVEKYIQLVEDGQFYPMKLGDWIAQETWDTISQINETDYGVNIIG
jgi:hypothetical protein